MDVLAQAQAFVASSPEALVGLTIEACRNTRCSQVTHGDVASNTGGLVGNLLASYSIHSLNGELALLVTFRDDGSPLLADGDVYTTKVTSSTGAVLAERRWTAAYETTYPNGEDCDPACRNATLIPSS